MNEGAPYVLVNGKYAVEEMLGEGAMAIVHRAVHVATERRVVLKRPHQRLLADPTILERFEREARAAGRIRSRHVVDVLDVDRDDEGPYLVMEYLDGESLGTRLEHTPRLDPHAVIAIVDQILAGAGAAHKAGVIHRDLKVSNVFLAREDGQERVKIVDFGISKLQEAARERARELTATGVFVGTPLYAAPEQVLGAGVGFQADLWAVGVITYRCLTGVHPFDAESDLALLTRIVNLEPLPLPSDLPRAVVTAFTPFLQRALAKSTAHRFRSAEEMRDALMQVKGALQHPMHAPTLVTSGQGSRWALSLSVTAGACALVLGIFTGIAPAHDASAGTFALEVSPGDATVSLDGVGITDPRRIAIPSGSGHAIDVSAPGHIARTIEPPTRGGRMIVALAPRPVVVPAPVPATPVATAPVPTPAPAEDDEERPANPTVRASPRPRPKPVSAVPAPAPPRSAIKPIARPPY